MKFKYWYSQANDIINNFDLLNYRMEQIILHGNSLTCLYEVSRIRLVTIEPFSL